MFRFSQMVLLDMCRIKWRMLIGWAISLSCLYSCEKEAPKELSCTIERISLDSIWKANNSINNSCSYNKSTFAGQGMSIFGQKMYRLFHTGICRVYDISDIENPKEITLFELGSFSSSNHGNSAQFDIREDGTAFLYVSSARELNGERGRCFVERIDDEGASLVQTITFDRIHLLSSFKGVNTICGDDGNLWVFGFNTLGTRMLFAKVRKPSLDEGAVIELSDSDILDYWYDSQYKYRSSVTQGGMIRGGYLFSVFGTSSTNRHIAIYDIKSHDKVGDIDLNAYVPEEPEDCDCYDGKILLSIYGGLGYYVLSLKKEKAPIE